MSNTTNYSGNENVSAGCNIDKAVKIINTVDDTNIVVEQEEKEPVINPDILISAAKDIHDTMKENSLKCIPDSVNNSADSNSELVEFSNTVNADNNTNNTSLSDSKNDNSNTKKDNELVEFSNTIYDTNNDTVKDDNNTKMINCKNKPITEDEWKARNSRGGRRCGENNQKRRTAKDIFGDLLRAQLSRENVDEILGESAQILGEDKTVYAVMCAKMIQIACAGDIKAFIAIRDTVGDKPAEEHLLTADIMTDSDRRMIDNLKKRMDKQALSLHNDNGK